MNTYRNNVGKTKLSNAKLSHSSRMLACAAASLLLNFSHLPAARARGTADGTGSEVQSYVKGPIAEASVRTLERAITLAVKADPAKAPQVIATILKSGRKPSCEENARYVAAAIAALGKNPPRAVVIAIVAKAVSLDPRCGPAIVGAAVKTAPAELAGDIVEVAIASVLNPQQLVAGNLTLAEAILNAALEARPGLDPVSLGLAADRGFASNLSTALNNSLPSSTSLAPGTILSGTSAVDNPNFSAFEQAMDENSPDPVNPSK